MLDWWGNWASIVGTLITIVVVGVPAIFWLKRRGAVQDKVRIETVVEPGPHYPEVPRELGFTPPAVKITVVNEGDQTVKLRDIRLMFCGEYGFPVVKEAPQGRRHPELPSDLSPGTVEHWYINAEELSSFLFFQHHPPSTTVSKSKKFDLSARCISGTGKVYESTFFQFP